jgi:hypothetical protein
MHISTVQCTYALYNIHLHGTVQSTYICTVLYNVHLHCTVQRTYNVHMHCTVHCTLALYCTTYICTVLYNVHTVCNLLRGRYVVQWRDTVCVLWTVFTYMAHTLNYVQENITRPAWFRTACRMQSFQFLLSMSSMLCFTEYTRGHKMYIQLSWQWSCVKFTRLRPGSKCTVYTRQVYTGQTAIFLYTVYCCHSVHSSSAFTEGGSSGPLAEIKNG